MGRRSRDKAGVSVDQEALSTAGRPPKKQRSFLGDPGRETGATKKFVFLALAAAFPFPSFPAFGQARQRGLLAQDLL